VPSFTMSEPPLLMMFPPAEERVEQEDGTRICGQAVITKLLRKSPAKIKDTSSCDGSSPGKRVYRFLRSPAKQPHDTDTDSSKSDHSTDELLTNEGVTGTPFYYGGAQFNPNEEHQQSIEVTDRDFLSPAWSATFPIPEEASSDVEDVSPRNANITVPGNSPPPKESVGSSPAQSEKISYLCSLVKKQQAAVNDLGRQNKHYSRKLAEYQNLLIKMKQKQVEKQRMIDQLSLDKEAYQAEARFLREELKKSDAERTYDNDMSDEELQQSLTDLIQGCMKDDYNSQSPPPLPKNDIKVQTLPSSQTSKEKDESQKKSRGGQSSASPPLVPPSKGFYSPEDEWEKEKSPVQSPVSSVFDTVRWDDEKPDLPEIVESRNDIDNTTVETRNDVDTVAATVHDPRSAYTFTRLDKREGDHDTSEKREEPAPPMQMIYSCEDKVKMREEVALFKGRLETLQQKRALRTQDRKHYAPKTSVVRFGNIE
jgi:hypothetical protein